MIKRILSIVQLCAILLFSFSKSIQAQTILEAESGTLNGVYSATTRAGFNGTGYVTGFDTAGDLLTVDFEVSETAAYKLEIIYAAEDSTVVNTLSIDNSDMEIDFGESSTFTNVNTAVVDLTAGSHSISIGWIEGGIDVDFFRLTPVAEVAAYELGNDVTRVEVEEGLLYGTLVEFETEGYSGTGYITSFDTGGDQVEIRVSAVEAGNYVLKIGYAGIYGEKTNNLSVNGGAVQQIQFPASDNFVEVSVFDVSLNQGVNTIEIINNWGWFNLDYLEFKKEVGMPPVAVAPDNIIAADEAEDGETITLDGSESSDPDGEIVSYSWTLSDDTEIGTDAMVTYDFSFGSHEVLLTVVDNDGNVATDNVLVILADLSNNGNNRVPIRGGEEELFMSGINLAWSDNGNFGRDMTNFVEADFEEIFDAIEGAGGNSCRWWLHTNGSSSPQFDASGNVTGLLEQEIPNMKKALDMAAERGIMISMCLWSFDMLQNNAGEANLDRNKALLEDASKTQTYIDNALIPIMEAIGEHPAVMAWEIFNEPEGMSELGWSDSRTEMQYVQQFINLLAGEIHRQAPTALVSNGSWSFIGSTDVGEGHFDYYTDERLIEAGGDADGILDFVQVHYYDHFTINESPFHNPASHWGIDKPIVIGEFPANGVEGISIEECYELAYDLGYAGALSWSWSDTQFGGMSATGPALQNLHDMHAADIDVQGVDGQGTVTGIDRDHSLSLYPNPTSDILNVVGSQNYRYQILDINGKQLQVGDLKGKLKQSISIQDIKKGVYFLKLMSADEIISRRFVKI